MKPLMSKVDLENLYVRKLEIQKNKILLEMKILISNNFTDLQEVIDYKNKTIDDLETFKNITKNLMEKNNIIKENYIELEKIHDDLNKL